MTVEGFNQLELASMDIVDITMNNGNTRREILYQGHAYLGTPERTTYTTGEIIPAQPPQILILGVSVTGVDGITLESVENVVFVDRVEVN
jgi:hypothetical protein